jgi:hypothetical protein
MISNSGLALLELSLELLVNKKLIFSKNPDSILKKIRIIFWTMRIVKLSILYRFILLLLGQNMMNTKKKTVKIENG